MPYEILKQAFIEAFTRDYMDIPSDEEILKMYSNPLPIFDFYKKLKAMQRKSKASLIYKPHWKNIFVIFIFLARFKIIIYQYYKY